MARGTSDDDGEVMNRSVGRRRLLGGGAVAAVGVGLLGQAPSAAGAGALGQAEGAASKPGSTNLVHSTTPPLEETRVGELVGLLTPTTNFFIRNHSASAAIDAATWSLRVD